ncbi:hypothetical protein AVEN_145202-1 [Araneus ventricosus]|uniref:Uncharacterized protein n=1 Tax=Araneus ventricosus TaxID=182803 RepID=A0A4Y2Q5P6_ARAVE|nr:hypothetical protein AVEN_145202-1 [Araneus ventricosus]
MLVERPFICFETEASLVVGSHPHRKGVFCVFQTFAVQASEFEMTDYTRELRFIMIGCHLMERAICIELGTKRIRVTDGQFLTAESAHSKERHRHKRP